MTDPLSKRVDRLRQHFFNEQPDPLERYTIRNIDVSLLERAEIKAGMPEDFYYILKEIGEVSDWGYMGAACISWWFPRTIEKTMEEELSFYTFEAETIHDADDLLFFANDVEAVCYFFNTKTIPWTIVAADGLDASLTKMDGITSDGQCYTWDYDGLFIEKVELFSNPTG